jgi:hypothetical protein
LNPIQRYLLGSARVGSNPAGVERVSLFLPEIEPPIFLRVLYISLSFVLCYFASDVLAQYVTVVLADGTLPQCAV